MDWTSDLEGLTCLVVIGKRQTITIRLNSIRAIFQLHWYCIIMFQLPCHHAMSPSPSFRFFVVRGPKKTIPDAKRGRLVILRRVKKVYIQQQQHFHWNITSQHFHSWCYDHRDYADSENPSSLTSDPFRASDCECERDISKECEAGQAGQADQSGQDDDDEIDKDPA